MRNRVKTDRRVMAGRNKHNRFFEEQDMMRLVRLVQKPGDAAPSTGWFAFYGDSSVWSLELSPFDNKTQYGEMYDYCQANAAGAGQLIGLVFVGEGQQLNP